MIYEVKWTPIAIEQLERNNAYLETEWGINVRESFNKKLHDLIFLLSNFPQLGSLVLKSKKIRAFTVTKNIKLFYRVRDNMVIILGVHNTRQDLSNSHI